MKVPKRNLIKRYNSIKIKHYNLGRSDSKKEYTKIINELNKQITDLHSFYDANLKSIKEKYDSQIESINDAHTREIETINKNYANKINALNSASKSSLDNAMEEFEQKVSSIKKIADEEIRKSHESEIKYQEFVTKTKILFDKGATKLMKILEDVDGIITDVAKMKHSVNEFFKTKDEFDSMLVINQSDITKIKSKQIGESKTKRHNSR